LIVRKIVLQIVVALALSLGAVLAHSVNVQAGNMRVDDAFAPASIGAAKSGAIYFTIINETGSGDRLIAVSTPAARKAELHSTKHEDGVMKMRKMPALDVPAGGQAELKKGGNHVMLFGLTEPLKEGDTVSLTLTFETAGEMTIEVPVKKAMHGMSH
jgi:copper(I)-binding protein